MAAVLTLSERTYRKVQRHLLPWWHRVEEAAFLYVLPVGNATFDCKVTVSTDDPAPGCYYCKGLRGKSDRANVQRYLREGVGAFLR
jgi:hypothetical protein